MTSSKPLKPAPIQTPVKRQDSSAEVDAFLAKVQQSRPAGQASGRLILALDATMSRGPTWDLACKLQGDMFDAAGKSGGLAMQLAYFRGHDECRVSPFVQNSNRLKSLMEKIDCRGGQTQIGKILAHAIRASTAEKVDALIFIGDALEEEIDELCQKAARLGLAGTPIFVFQEGRDAVTEQGLREIARLSRGAWFSFDRNSAGHLAGLLSAIARYAMGGLKALEASTDRSDIMLLEHLSRKK